MVEHLDINVCAKKLFNEMSDSAVKYNETDSYEKFLGVTI